MTNGPGTPKRAPRRHGRRSAPISTTSGQDLREAILAATEHLLASHRFGDLSVADILTAASVSRGSFYFYFDGKHDVLAELVKRVVARGHEAAEPWLATPDGGTAGKADALRAGTAAGARLWLAHAPVLRAIVENWRTDPRLTALWLDQMRTFTDAAVRQIESDPVATARLAGRNVEAVAGGLCWLGERLYYLAACGVAPYDDEDTLIDTLSHFWTSTLYGEPPPGATGVGATVPG
ncbi:TetR/AcrR family transcriptional regulator [Pseudonocardia acaciae]|uniref:TetR/AcrR family transcriptional regulator n=1 Tax=Pseudonocardia acaciae TaxID=551276 RepID=UPI0006882C2C|nr:TetR/AcrR family transcriptional regulator [Pseudonocardia acaciae]